jgi:hypothetical protein
MAWWTGTWEFKNVFHDYHGKSGETIVEAGNEREAEEIIKLRASRKLFGYTGMCRYIDVSNLREEKK